MNNFRFIRILLALMLALMVLGSNPKQARAQETTPMNDMPALMAKADERGTVRVIVGLDIGKEFTPEGYLSPEEAKLQRQAIKDAQRAAMSSMEGNGLFTTHSAYEFIPYMALEVNTAALTHLSRLPIVTSIREDKAVPADLASSTKVIGAPTVWESGYTGSGWTVAVLDTGTQWDHPFLGGSAASRVVSEACYSATGTDIQTLCPNGLEIQETGHAADPTIATCINGSTNLCAHGTHVAGIVAGDGATFDGVAPGANILAIQVFSRFNSTSDCGSTAPCVMSYDSDQMDGLQRVYDLRGSYDIASVNMSLGGDRYTAYCDTDYAAMKALIDTLLSVDIATIIATGNNGYTDSISAPACISTAVAVGATTDYDTVASFSNSSSLVDLLAPGTMIYSSIPTGTYANYQGTSMATPHVAGAWAVLMGISPSSTPAQILSALSTNGVSVTDTRNSVTKPRIQLDAAAAYLKPAMTWLGDTTDWNTAANWSTAETPTGISTAIIPASPSGGNFPTLSAAGNVYDLTIQNGASMTMTGGTFNIYGDFTVQASGGFNGTGGMTIFQGAMSQAVSMPDNATNQFYHLQIGDGTTTQKVIPSSAIDVNGNLDIAAGASLQPGSNTLYVAGNWTDAESKFSPGTSTVVFDGAGGQSAQITASSLTLLQETFSPYNIAAYNTFYYVGPSGWKVENTSGGNYPWFFTGWARNPNTALNGHIRHYREAGGNTTSWVFTPALTLNSGMIYQLQYKYGVYTDTIPCNLRVGIGNAQTSASMSTTLRDFTNLTNTTWNTDSINFTVGSDGTYYIGFRAYQTTSTLDDVSIDDVTVTVIPKLIFYNLTVSAGGSGAALADNAWVKNNLTVNNGGHFALGTSSLAVDGALTNNGKLSQVQSVPASSTTQFLRIFDVTGGTAKYYGVDITPSSAMGSTTVVIKGNQSACTTASADPLIHRCFEVNPGTAVNATLRYWYTEAERNGQAADALKLWHYNGGGSWTEVGGPYSYSESGTACTSGAPAGSACWFEAQNVSTYSPFGIGSGGTPTVIGLNRLAVTPAGSWLPLGLLTLAACGGLWVIARQRRK